MTSVRTLPTLVPALGLAAVLALAGCSGGTGADPGSGGTGAEESSEASTSSEPVAAPPGDPVADCEVSTDHADVPDELWGMHAASPMGEAFPRVPVSLVNLTTSATYWPYVETAPGEYDWTRLDTIVEATEEEDATPVLVLGFSPDFHASGSGATARATMPDVEAWETYVQAVAERYGDRFDYQVWPEPNIGGNWAGTPAEMAELTIRASDVLEEAAPDARVVAAATTLRLEPQRAWMDEFWGATYDGRSPGDVVDVASIDPYPMEDGTPEDSLDLVCDAVGILEKHGVDLPVWTNEINYGVPSGGNATDVTHYSDEQQAAYVARTYLLHAAVGLDSVQWLGWGSYPGMAVAMTEDDNTTPSTAATAYEVVHGWLGGGPRPACSVEGTGGAEHYTCATDDLEVHWTTGEPTTVPAPDGATEVSTLDGETTAVEPGEDVEVTGQPVAFVLG